MKNIKELKEKIVEMQTLYDNINNSNSRYKQEEKIIFGHWIDYISDLLDYNMVNYCEKIGFDIENNDMFEITEDIEKQIAITKEQAEKEYKILKKFYTEHPYGTCKNEYYINGIYIEKLELDILKWFLEID